MVQSTQGGVKINMKNEKMRQAPDRYPVILPSSGIRRYIAGSVISRLRKATHDASIVAEEASDAKGLRHSGKQRLLCSSRVTLC